MKKYLLLILIFSTKILAKNLEQATLKAIESTKFAKKVKRRAEKNITNKIKNIPHKDISLKALAVTRVLADREIDLPLDRSNSFNINYKNKSILYNFKYSF